ncbi:MAG: A/G-specific adenine glycosylase [Lachnospiraceae bacterium]|nr:A/G-specific adenine glycosylase [Lachnospiraceae bacterium]
MHREKDTHDSWIAQEFEHLYDEVQILEETEEFTDEERLKKAVPALLSWFGRHARVLPWREEPTPYRVWISEIMLQQTRVEAVKPYFERFLQAFPSVEALAAAEEDRLLKMWEGLGYYNRARNLQRAAKEILDRYDGKMPGDYAELQTLPGIGSYTAGAVSSIAFGRKVPAVDGNVLRVISRVTASRKDITDVATKKQMEALLLNVMPEKTPGEFNQALMEVGATVCIPRGEPLCGECPFESLCLAGRHKLTGEIPVKKAQKARRVEQRTILLFHDGERVFVRKRPAKGLLAGLYEFPNETSWLTEQEIKERAKRMTAGWQDITFAGDATHIFSHVEWHMKGYLIRVPKGSIPVEFAADVGQLKTQKAIPNAFILYTRKIMGILEKNEK